MQIAREVRLARALTGWDTIAPMGGMSAARRGLTLAVILAAMGASDAKGLDPDLRLSQLQVTQWNRERGFPATTVLRLVQTADGSLWIGTGFGLVRFDGRRFTAYKRATHPGLPSDNVAALAVEGEVLWVGTAAGLARLERGELVRVTAGVPEERIDHVWLDRGGGLWVATGRQVFRREGEAFVLVRDANGAPTGQARSFVQTADGSIWMNGPPLRRWRDGRVEPVDVGDEIRLVVDDGKGGFFAIGSKELLLYLIHI